MRDAHFSFLTGHEKGLDSVYAIVYCRHSYRLFFDIMDWGEIRLQTEGRRGGLPHPAEGKDGGREGRSGYTVRGYRGEGEPKYVKLPNEPNSTQAGVEILFWESQKRSQLRGV